MRLYAYVMLRETKHLEFIDRLKPFKRIILARFFACVQNDTLIAWKRYSTQFEFNKPQEGLRGSEQIYST